MKVAKVNVCGGLELVPESNPEMVFLEELERKDKCLTVRVIRDDLGGARFFAAPRGEDERAVLHDSKK